VEVTSLFQSGRRSTNWYLRVRSALTPYGAIASNLPAQGRIVDLGSGHGLLSIALVLGSDRREIIGIDHDLERVRLAQSAALNLPPASRPRFEVGDLGEALRSFATASLTGVAMIDMLHYFDRVTQRTLIDEAARVLAPGGILAVREIDADAGIKAAVNQLYERLATGIGFTKSGTRTLSFRGALAWTAELEAAGFAVRSQPCGPPFLADILFVARKL